MVSFIKKALWVGEGGGGGGGGVVPKCMFPSLYKLCGGAQMDGFHPICVTDTHTL